MNEMGADERLALPRQKSWPLRRCAELTDGLRRAKLFRFADSEGLPLVSVFRSDSSDSFTSTTSLCDSPPTELGFSAAVASLRPRSSSLDSISDTSLPSPIDRRQLHFEHDQPVASPDFQRLLQRNLVCLENVAAQGMTIFGTVRVRNVAFEKMVVIRYSVDDWKTHSDLLASYVEGSCDGPTDRFSFTLVIGDDLPARSRVQFAVNFRAAGGDYWDNNSSQNYTLRCEAAPASRQPAMTGRSIRVRAPNQKESS